MMDLNFRPRRRIDLRAGLLLRIKRWTSVWPPLVRFGSQADMPSPRRHVCFTPESGHCNHDTECRLRATSGITDPPLATSAHILRADLKHQSRFLSSEDSGAAGDRRLSATQVAPSNSARGALELEGGTALVHQWPHVAPGCELQRALEVGLSFGPV